MNYYYKHAISATMVLAVVLALPSTAQSLETSANVTLTTDYKFRGISQNDTGPALQGGFDLAFENGIYVGTWGSTVDFELTGNSNPAMELDYYVGYGGSITEAFSYDIGVIYYDYPTADATNFSGEGYNKDRDLDYVEVYGSVGYQDLTVGYAFSDDYWQETGKFNYFYIDYDLELRAGWSYSFHVGYNDFSNSSTDNDVNDANEAFLSNGEDNYTDYSITFTKSFYGLDLSFSFVDTDLDEKDCWDTDWCDSSGIFSISKSL